MGFFDDWAATKRIELEFKKRLEMISDSLKKIAESSNGNQFDFERKMNEFQNSNPFKKFVLSAVRRMVTPLSTKSYSTWRKAARKSTRSNEIYTALMAELKGGLQGDIDKQIEENAKLIRTLPNDVAKKVVSDISQYTFEGKRAKEIEKLIVDKTSQHSRASARLIARTEVSKTNSALIQARSERIGSSWYVWETAQDGDRVRKSHRIMQGVLVNWNDPPSPEFLAGEQSVGNYHAGCIWNCRCYPAPVIDIDFIDWPNKVHVNGIIKKMSKEEFKKIM